MNRSWAARILGCFLVISILALFAGCGGSSGGGGDDKLDPEGPSAQIDSPATDLTISQGQSIVFKGTAYGASPFTYAWSFGGGAPDASTEDPGNITFNTTGTYMATLTVTDAQGLTSKATRKITVNERADTTPVVSITSPTDGATVLLGQSLNFQGTVSSGESPYTYSWNFGGGAANASVEDPGNVVFASAGAYTVTFTVTDADGDTGIKTIRVTVNAVALSTWYRDADGDGYGNPGSSTQAASKPTGYVANSTDCNDAAASVHPGATDIVGNGIDENCDGYDLRRWYRDADGDGYGNPAISTTANTQPSGYVADFTDCSDSNAAIHPGQEEIQGNGVDDNCDGVIDSLFADNFEGTDCLSGWTVGGRQAEGTNTANCVVRNGSLKGHLYKYSFTEITLSPDSGDFVFSDDLRFDFDMEVRTASSGGAPSNYYGKAGVFFNFKDSSGTTIGSVDYIAATTSYPFDTVASDPTSAAIEVTQNVNTHYSLPVEDILSHITIDETAVASVQMYYMAYSSTRPIPEVEAELWVDNVKVYLLAPSIDADGDGYSPEQGDCDDGDVAIHPGAVEVCGDGKDNDCDGFLDEGCGSSGGSALFNSSTPVFSNMTFNYLGAAFDSIFGYPPHWLINYLDGYMEFTFVDPRDFSFHALGSTCQGVSLCNIDVFVNGLLYWSNLYIDNAWLWYTIASSHFITGMNTVRITPVGQTNFWIDEANSTTNLGTWYIDVDGDGFGDPDHPLLASSLPAGYVVNNTDCNDQDASIHPGATEICGDGIDQDCSGSDSSCTPDTIRVPADYATIQGAVDAASNGNTILVSSGTYTENVDVDKQVIIRSENGYGSTTVVAVNASDHVFDVQADYVTIDGFTIYGATAGTGYPYSASIYVGNGFDGCTIINNRCGYDASHRSVFGISLYASDNNLVENNIARNNSGAGIYRGPFSSNNMITGNTSSGNQYGIYMSTLGSNNTVTSNVFSENSYGMYLDNSSGDFIYLNSLVNNTSRNTYAYGSSCTWNSPTPISYSYNNSTYTGYLGNYFSDYVSATGGNDADGNGIGSVAYVVDSTNSDTDAYPLWQVHASYSQDTIVSWYMDADGDGYSNGTTLSSATRPGADYYLASELLAISGDLYDDDPDSYPGATEICSDGRDNDCDGFVDEGCDSSTASVILNSPTPVLNDMTFDYLGAEYDSVYNYPPHSPHWMINSLDGYMTFTFTDPRNFSFHALGSTYQGVSLCNIDVFVNGLLYWSNLFIDKDWLWYTIASSQFVSGANTVRIVAVGQTNFWIDEANATADLGTWYMDSDEDGFGDPDHSTLASSQPTGYVANNTDCDDGNAAVHPGATEVCGDGIDQNCDGHDCTDITNNLIARWTFDDNNATDITGNGYTGTMYGSPAFSTGVSGNAMVFDGSNDHVQLNNSLNINEVGAISFWVNTDGYDGVNDHQTILAEYSWYGYRSFILKINNDSTSSNCSVAISLFPYGDDYTVDSASSYYQDPTSLDPNTYTIINNLPFEPNNWKHIVININSSEIAIWIDGQITNKTRRSYQEYFNSSEPTYIGNTFLIGDDFVYNYRMNGMLDDMRIYDRSLTEEEIQDLFNLVF